LLAFIDYITKRLQRIFHWFHNNTRPTSALSKSKQNVIPVQKLGKRPAAWQAYQKLYWEKLKPLVDKAFNAHIKGLSEGEKAKPKIQIQSEVVRGEYEKEADDPKVKAEVERYILEFKEESNENSAEKFQ
jgi:hypothetical protein